MAARPQPPSTRMTNLRHWQCTAAVILMPVSTPYQSAHKMAPPVLGGGVASLNRPNGNMTGVAALQAELVAKRIELLHELAPKAAVVALLVNPTNRYTETETRVLQEGARSLGLQLHILRASTASEIDAAFGTLAELRSGALVVSADLFLLSRREQVVALAARHALPAIYGWREYAAVGSMMSYGPSLFDAYRLVGVYIGKILKGAKPADLPVEQTTKVEFVINLKTAKMLGLTFPITRARLPVLSQASRLLKSSWKPNAQIQGGRQTCWKSIRTARQGSASLENLRRVWRVLAALLAASAAGFLSRP